MRTRMKRSARPRVRWACLTAGIMALSFGAAQAADPRAPKGPVELTVGSGAGSVPDTFMRRAAKILNEEKIIDNPIGVVNRAGGSWMTAANHVLNRPKDENLVITVSTGALFATPIVQGLPTVHDRLTPIGMFVFNDLVLIANPSVPAANLKELSAHGKKAEARLRFGGAQAASVDRIIAGLVDRATGLKLNYIPFDGGGAVTAAFLGGNVELTATAADEAVELVKSGKAKALAILTEQRRAEPELKDIATAKEQGFDVVFAQELGLAGPPNLDPAVVAWWDERLRKLAESKAWTEAAKELFLRKDYIGADKARAHVDQMHEQHLAILREVGLAKK